MEKEFISYEQALALKELGFDKECFGFYDVYNNKNHLLLNDRYEPLWFIRTWQRIFCKKYQDTTFISQSYVEYINGVCLAPLYQQAFTWFREKTKYTIEFEVKRNAKELVFLDNYYFIIYDSNRLDFDISKETFDTYKEAELECLKKLIEIVRNENLSF